MSARLPEQREAACPRPLTVPLELMIGDAVPAAVEAESRSHKVRRAACLQVEPKLPRASSICCVRSMSAPPRPVVLLGVGNAVLEVCRRGCAGVGHRAAWR